VEGDGNHGNAEEEDDRGNAADDQTCAFQFEVLLPGKEEKKIATNCAKDCGPRKCTRNCTLNCAPVFAPAPSVQAAF